MAELRLLPRGPYARRASTRDAGRRDPAGAPGTSSDPAIAAVVAFAQQVLATPAEIGDADFERLRAHGYRDEQIAEVAGLVGLQLLTGGFNLIAGIHAPAEALAELTSPVGG